MNLDYMNKFQMEIIQQILDFAWIPVHRIGMEY